MTLRFVVPPLTQRSRVMHEWWLIKEKDRRWEVVRSDDARLWSCHWKWKAGLNESFAKRVCEEYNRGRDEQGNVLKFR